MTSRVDRLRTAKADRATVCALITRTTRLERLLGQWLDFDRDHSMGVPERRREALVRLTRRALKKAEK